MIDKLLDKLILKLAGIDCNKRNPVEYDKLLRSPGQSLDEAMDGIRNKILDKLFFILAIMIVFIILSITLQFPSYYQIIFMLIFLGYVISLLQKYYPVLRDYRLGRDGERSVAQYLSAVARQLSKEDANMHIYHDLVNEKKKFNIDHVIVSKKGIFIVETKTYRKDQGTTNTIFSNGKELIKNGQKLTNNIPLQIKGQAQWLQSELHQITGKKYQIIKIIAFVGWYVEGEKIDDIYITTAKTLKNIIENQYSKILYDDEELKRITSCIHKLATVGAKNYTDICE